MREAVINVLPDDIRHKAPAGAVCAARLEPASLSSLESKRGTDPNLVHHVADDVPAATQQNNCTTYPKHRNENDWHLDLLCKSR